MAGNQEAPDAQGQLYAPFGLSSDITPNVQPQSGSGGNIPQSDVQEPSGSGATPQQPKQLSPDQQLQQILSGLTYGQIMNPQGDTAQQISQLLGGMPIADAQKWLKQLPAGALTNQVNQYLSGQNPNQPQQKSSQTDDALTMGLGMFFQQYVAPMLAQQSQTNNALIKNYGTAMDQAASNPLPAGVASILKAGVPQQQQLMQAISQGALTSAGETIPLGNLTTSLQAQTAATQALQDAFSKAATYQELGAGSPTSLAGLLSGALGGSGTLAGGLAQLLGGGGGVLTPSNPAISAAVANQNAGTGYTPPKTS